MQRLGNDGAECSQSVLSYKVRVGKGTDLGVKIGCQVFYNTNEEVSETYHFLSLCFREDKKKNK